MKDVNNLFYAAIGILAIIFCFGLFADRADAANSVTLEFQWGIGNSSSQ